jgi:hypothetical protein
LEGEDEALKYVNEHRIEAKRFVFGYQGYVRNLRGGIAAVFRVRKKEFWAGWRAYMM